MTFVNSKICNSCGTCIEVCPTSAISLQHNFAFIDQALCQNCEICVDACPQGAILATETMPIEPEVADLIPAVDTAISIVPNQPRPLLWWDTVVSTLVWTGREIVPRLANIAVSYLEQRMLSSQSIHNYQNVQVLGQRTGNQNGKGFRQRRRQRQFR